MFFIPGYIVRECQADEGQLLFQQWKQAIRERDSDSKRVAQLALAGYFRSRRRGERDQQAAAFLESLGGVMEHRPSSTGVVRQQMEQKRGTKRSGKRTGKSREHWQQWK